MESDQVLKRYDNGVSLPVESVQALASKDLEEIPTCYLRPEVELDQFSLEESIDIPVLDMSKLLDQNPLVHHDELEKLHLACKDWGFFQVQSQPNPKNFTYTFSTSYKAEF